jgi:hypothetical protein
MLKSMLMLLLRLRASSPFMIHLAAKHGCAHGKNPPTA